MIVDRPSSSYRNIANYPYVKFTREYAKKHFGLDVMELSMKACKAWNKLSNVQRRKYQMVDDAEAAPPAQAQVVTKPDDSDDTCCPTKRRSRPKSCCPAPKPRCPMRRKPRCAPKSRCASKPRCPMKSRCAPKRKTCPKPRCGPKRRSRCGKPKCQSPGPVTNNGYLNFLRDYRRKHCGLKPKDLVMKAARAWCRLPECKKDEYRRQACKVTTSCRHKRRRVCTAN